MATCSRETQSLAYIVDEGKGSMWGSEEHAMGARVWFFFSSSSFRLAWACNCWLKVVYVVVVWMVSWKDGESAGNKVSDVGLEALAPALAKLTLLKTLQLSGKCVCTSPLVCAALPAPKRPCSLCLPWHTGVLVELLPAGNNITDAGLKALAPSLARLTQLQTLHLNGECKCGSAYVCLTPSCVRCSPHAPVTLLLALGSHCRWLLPCLQTMKALVPRESRPWRPP